MANQALDEIRRGAADRVLGLLHTGSLAIRALDAEGGPLPRVLVTVMGEDGGPVLDLYDRGFDPDDEGRVVVPEVPGGSYSVRLHRELEFQREEGYDVVWVGRVEVRPGPEPAVVVGSLRPGGRVRVTLTDASGAGVPARLVVKDPAGRRVAATFWRDREGGWTTEHLPPAPGLVSCVLPPGRYRIQAVQIRDVVASGEVTVTAGETADLSLTAGR